MAGRRCAPRPPANAGGEGLTLRLPGDVEIVSVITKSSAERLKLSEGTHAYAVIKASNVMIGVD